MQALLQSVPRPCSRPPSTHTSPETPGHSRASRGQSCGIAASSSWVLVHTRFCLCPPRVCFSCKFCWLCAGINSDLLKEGSCHTQVCCTQNPCPCGRPLLTCIFAGDTQTQLWLSLCGVSGSWWAQTLFEPSEHFWWVRALILNVISPLQPSCWGFSFALQCGVSFLARSNILQSMVVQLRVVVSEFSQEKMSTCPSTTPSYTSIPCWDIISQICVTDVVC